MNKYLVTIGEIILGRISEDFIVYTKDSKEELEDNEEFLYSVDEIIYDLYNNYGEEDEDWEDFRDSMGIMRIEDWEDKFESYTSDVLYDER